MDRFSPEELLFEIPVYRLSEQAYYNDLDALMTRKLAKSDQYRLEEAAWRGREEHEERTERHAMVERVTRRREGRPWLYNEMIGVIRLYEDNGAIKGEYWGQPHSRFRRNFQHRRMEHLGRVLEWHPAIAPETSAEVFETLLRHLAEITLDTSDMLAGRYLDLQAFRRIGAETDWLAVLGWGSGRE